SNAQVVYDSGSPLRLLKNNNKNKIQNDKEKDQLFDFDKDNEQKKDKKIIEKEKFILHSNHGDPQLIGLSSIEIFDQDGKLIKFKNPENQISFEAPSFMEVALAEFNKERKEKMKQLKEKKMKNKKNAKNKDLDENLALKDGKSNKNTNNDEKEQEQNQSQDTDEYNDDEFEEDGLEISKSDIGV
ncbi:MAG: hypothetical protein EZS28_039216, partial [Streblomastix strix]